MNATCRQCGYKVGRYTIGIEPCGKTVDACSIACATKLVRSLIREYEQKQKEQ